MPAVNQSLVPYNPLGRPNYGDGTSYTNSIDAALAVAGQTGGSLAVVPNSPAAMNVLVDTGYNIQAEGAGVQLQAGNSPTLVSLVAPGSNSYYATIYYNKLTNACGVIYGTPGASPTPVCTDQVSQIPLALVLIASTATSITATNIKDIRLIWTYGVSKVITLSGNLSIDCQWATYVDIAATITAASGVTLTNLRQGAHVSFYWLNSTGGIIATSLAATTPSGASIACIGNTASAVSLQMDTPAFNIAAGTRRHFIGSFPIGVTTMLGVFL
jgi:hypothetical protein